MLNSLVRKAATKIGISYVLGQIRAAAEGKLGPEWKARYWALEGKKTWTGFAFLVLTAILIAIGQDDAAKLAGLVAGGAISAGLADKAWRTDIPGFLLRSRLYQWLAGNAELVTSAFTMGAAAVASVEGPEQKTYALILAAFAAVAVQLGLLDAAWKAGPPAVGRITQFMDGIEHVFCDRCGKALVKSVDRGTTAGYYRVVPGGYWPSNPGEDVVCDDCMWTDPRYIAKQGIRHQRPAVQEF